MLLILPDDLLFAIVNRLKRDDPWSYASLCATCKRLTRPWKTIAELFWTLPCSTTLLHPSQLYHLSYQYKIGPYARVSGYVVRDKQKGMYRLYEGRWTGPSWPSQRLLFVGRRTACGESVVYSGRYEVARLRRCWFGKFGNRVSRISGNTQVEDIGMTVAYRKPHGMRCVVHGHSYTTREPILSPDDGRWYQDFYGKVLIVSHSNYQLVSSDTDDSNRRKDDVRFTFGRLGKNIYFIEYDPLRFTAVDAMIIAMYRV